MKSSIFFLIFVLFSFLSSTLSIHAQSGEIEQNGENNEITTSTIIEKPLLIDSINTPDDAHIVLKFNQGIISESVRVRVTKQSNESNVRIESFTGGETTDSIKIILSDILETNTSYKITIISAISDGGIIIKDGADALKEFTTPSELPRFLIESEFNAPNNPNAVIVEKNSDPSNSTGVTVQNEGVVKINPSETIEELPLTGANSTVFGIIAGILGLVLILRRRQA